jgi:hypothetical protein
MLKRLKSIELVMEIGFSGSGVYRGINSLEKQGLLYAFLECDSRPGQSITIYFQDSHDIYFCF